MPAQIYDLSRELAAPHKSVSSWQFGYSIRNLLAPNQFRMDAYKETRSVFTFWHPRSATRPGAGYYPYVTYNQADETQLEPTKGWAARAHEVAMEASNCGQYSIVRFIVPAKGKYSITARFAGLHFNLSSTDVHILRNAQTLFEAEIDGYGGDPAFHAIQGAHPTASYSGLVELSAQDTLMFAVGYGRNKTNYNDTTGVFVVLTKNSKNTHP